MLRAATEVMRRSSSNWQATLKPLRPVECAACLSTDLHQSRQEAVVRICPGRKEQHKGEALGRISLRISGRKLRSGPPPPRENKHRGGTDIPRGRPWKTLVRKTSGWFSIPFMSCWVKRCKHCWFHYVLPQHTALRLSSKCQLSCDKSMASFAWECIRASKKVLWQLCVVSWSLQAYFSFLQIVGLTKCCVNLNGSPIWLIIWLICVYVLCFVR